MINEWFALVLRASVLLLVTGSCVVLLSRFYPMTSPRWHRFAWGAVLLQGLAIIPVSLTIETPAWLNNQTLYSPETRRDSLASREPDPPEGTRMPVSANERPADFSSRETPQMLSGSVRHYASAKGEIETQPVRLSDTIPSALLHQAVSGQQHPATEQKGLPVSGSKAIVTPATETLMLFASGIQWTDWPALLWICGVIGLIGFGLVNYLILNIALLNSRPARRSWAKELQDLSLELNLDRRVALDVHSVVGPLICRTPAGHRIVVPIGLWSELSSEERIAVLHHELSHLRRGDLWKSLLARLVLALHWFNPLAWISARRFDESAEWACDALMASERPARVAQLANALLAATTARDGSPILALSATGGPLFQRIRRLVSWDQQGDTVMQRVVWGGMLCPLVILGLFQLQFTERLAAQTANDSGGAANASVDEQNGQETAGNSSESTNELNEIAERVIADEQQNLKEFIAAIRTPTGRIVMADRAALHAQNAANEMDDVSQWQQFVSRHFMVTGSTISVNAAFQEKSEEYVAAVSEAEADVMLIGPVLKEVAAALDTTTEPAQFLHRFLNHEGAPVFVYMNELRSRLHPRIEDLSEVFSELLVRDKEGQFVIRPARRRAVEEAMKNMDRFQPMLKRFHEELTAWSQDLANPDKRHDNLKTMLADPSVAVFLASRNLTEDDEPNDEHFDDYFYLLEEATDDAPSGLILNPESEQLNEIESELSRFSAIQQNRKVLEKPLQELIDRLDQSDDLHVRLKKYLSTDLALMKVVREMDYSPITADNAAREWLSNAVTKGDNGKYTITSESPEDVKSQCENYFREFRELRRRGRTIDEFASQLSDKEMTAAIQTLSGKLLLQDLVRISATRPDVNGLQLWISAHFEETAEGLKLHDWAGDEINSILAEVAELEKQLSKTDF